MRERQDSQRSFRVTLRALYRSVKYYNVGLTRRGPIRRVACSAIGLVSQCERLKFRSH